MTIREASFDTARLRALAEAATPGKRAVAGSRILVDDTLGAQTWGPNWRNDQAYIAAADPPTMLALLDEIERLRGAQQVWRDRFGTHWESLPNGDLRARIGARYTREEAEESYGPLEPVEGGGDE